MNGRYLLDTYIIIDLFRGDPETVSRIKLLRRLHVPVIALGELYFGANKSRKTSARMLEIEHLEQVVIVEAITRETARVYGELKEQLLRQGTMIPENDIWIAATAILGQFILVTRDRHFLNIEELQVELFHH